MYLILLFHWLKIPQKLLRTLHLHPGQWTLQKTHLGSALTQSKTPLNMLNSKVFPAMQSYDVLL